jgi:hypothetical protein
MFVRLLSYNADFVDKEWADDQQSHWNIPARQGQDGDACELFRALLAVTV